MTYGHLFEQLAQPVDRPLSEEERAQSLGLTLPQAKAVLSSHQGMIVTSASAGSGKTRVLLARTKNLLKQGVAAKDILLCAFTRAAAEEMTHRLKETMGKSKEIPSVATIHSQQMRLFRDKHDLKLLDEENCQEQIEALRDLCPELLEGLSDEAVITRLGFEREVAEHTNSDWHLVCQAWEEILAEQGLLDFVGLLRLGLSEPPVRKYKHILVDEGQDLTGLQLKWVKHHLAKNGTVFYVGDDLQSIYAFRGGNTDVLSQLIAQGAKHFLIEENFRSAQKVIETANAFMQNRGLTMRSCSKEQGIVQCFQFPTLSEEIEFAIELQRKYKSFCVLTRTNELSALFRWKGLNAMTIHQSKGREFDCTFVCGLEKGVFPHNMAKIEEERRLMYVAITRAKSRLILSTSPKKINGKEFANPSDFYQELNEIVNKG